MDDRNNIELKVDDIMRQIKEEVERKKQGRQTFQQATPAPVPSSGLFGFVKRAQMIASKLPLYSIVYRIAVKFKRFVK